MCLERCSVSLLYAARILREDLSIFERREVRAKTAMLYATHFPSPFSLLLSDPSMNLWLPRYKQQKFNLLREESEGYAKLAVELLSNLGPPHSSVDGQPEESVKQRMLRARAAGDSLKSLIGKTLNWLILSNEIMLTSYLLLPR